MTKKELEILMEGHQRYNNKIKMSRDIILIVIGLMLTWFSAIQVRTYWGNWEFIAEIGIGLILILLFLLTLHWQEAVRYIDSYSRMKILENQIISLLMKEDDTMIKILREVEGKGFLREENKNNILKLLRENTETFYYKILQGLIYRDKGYLSKDEKIGEDI